MLICENSCIWVGGNEIPTSQLVSHYGGYLPAGIRKYIEEGNDPSTLPAYSVGAMLPSLVFLILAIHFYNKEKQKLSEIDVFLDADDFNEEVDDVEVIP